MIDQSIFVEQKSQWREFVNELIDLFPIDDVIQCVYRKKNWHEEVNLSDLMN